MAESPDVRVRLSAEGVDEVVRALEKVKAAGDRAGKSGKGFGVMNSALGDLKSLLPQLGVAAAVTGLVAMTKNALESADAIGKLSQKTGFSTKTLSVLNIAAELADASIESMSKGLTKFNKGMAELDEGSASAGESVRRLFGSSKALDGLNTEEKFFKVAQAIGGMEAGYKKTKAAQDFFGKSGADLIPLLDDLANGGFEEAAKKAQKLGLIIDQDLAVAAQKANDSMKELEMATKGAALQFTAGLAPALAESADALTDAVSGDGVNGLKKLGEYVGFVAKLITAGFITVGKTIGFVMNEVVERVDNTIERVKLLGELLTSAPSKWKAVFQKAAQFEENAKARSKDRTEFFQSELGDSLAKLFPDENVAKPSDTKKKKGGGGGGGEPDAAAQKASLNLLKARLEQESAWASKFLDLEQQQAQQAYEEGKISLGKYYDERRAILKDRLDGEIATLQAKRELEKKTITNSTSEETAKRAAIEAIDAQIEQKTLDRAQKLDALALERSQKEEAFAKRRAEIESQIMTAQGRTYEAAIAAIRLQAEEMRKAGVDPQAIDNLTSALTRQAGVQDLQRTGGNALAGIDTMKAGLDNQVAGGAIFPFEALQQYQASIRSLIPDLQALAVSQRAAAVTPEEILAAEQFANQVDALGIQADETALQMAQFKQNLESSLNSNLTNFFTTGIQEAENFGDAMRGLALSVVDSLRQMAAQMLANIATQQLLKAVGGAFGFSGGGLVAAASGGYISGPGTGTSDSIPARLSDGEFVVRSAVVRQPGVLESLVALNHGMGRASVAGRGSGIPRARFAEGGLVTAGDAIESGITFEADIATDEGVMFRKMRAFLKSPDGQRIQIENLGQNQKRASSALGRR